MEQLIEALESEIQEIRQELDRLDNYSGKEQALYKRIKEIQRTLDIAKALQG